MIMHPNCTATWEKQLHSGDDAFCQGKLTAAAAWYEEALTTAERGRNIPAQRQILHRLSAVNELRNADNVADRTQAALDFVVQYEGALAAHGFSAPRGAVATMPGPRSARS